VSLSLPSGEDERPKGHHDAPRLPSVPSGEDERPKAPNLPPIDGPQKIPRTSFIPKSPNEPQKASRISHVPKMAEDTPKPRLQQLPADVQIQRSAQTPKIADERPKSPRSLQSSINTAVNVHAEKKGPPTPKLQPLASQGGATYAEKGFTVQQTSHKPKYSTDKNPLKMPAKTPPISIPKRKEEKIGAARQAPTPASTQVTNQARSSPKIPSSQNTTQPPTTNKQQNPRDRTLSLIARNFDNIDFTNLKANNPSLSEKSIDDLIDFLSNQQNTLDNLSDM